MKRYYETTVSIRGDETKVWRWNQERKFLIEKLTAQDPVGRSWWWIFNKITHTAICDAPNDPRGSNTKHWASRKLEPLVDQNPSSIDIKRKEACVEFPFPRPFTRTHTHARARIHERDSVREWFMRCYFLFFFFKKNKSLHKILIVKFYLVHLTGATWYYNKIVSSRH